MNKKLMFILPLVGIAIIPQLLFFWLNSDADCAMIVYGFGTVMTLVHFGCSYALWYIKETRRTVPIIAAGSIIMLVILFVGGWLMLSRISVRSTAFVMTILTMIYFVMVSILYFLMEEDVTITSDYDDTFSERQQEPICDLDNNYENISNDRNNRLSQKDKNKSVSCPPSLPSKH